MLCGVFALLIKPIDFLTFSATPSWHETAAWGRGGGGLLATVWRENCKEPTCRFSWFSRSWWLGHFKTIIQINERLRIRSLVFECLLTVCCGVLLTAIVIIDERTRVKLRGLGTFQNPSNLKSRFKFTRSFNYPLQRVL